MSLKPFYGNCEQIRFIEAFIAANPNCILVDKGIRNAPLFEAQREFESQLIIMQYSYFEKGGFFPKEQTIRFSYNRNNNKAEVKMTRKLADILLGRLPELKLLNSGDNGGK